MLQATRSKKTPQLARRSSTVMSVTVSTREFLLSALSLVAIGATALALVDATHERRMLYQQLDELQKQQNAMMAEHSRLLLERSAVASMHQVEQVAQAKLDMQFPPVVAEVVQ